MISLPHFWVLFLHRVLFKNLEAVTRMCFVKKVFLKISQNSQENTCTRVYILIKLQALGSCKRDTGTEIFLGISPSCEIFKSNLF